MAAAVAAPAPQAAPAVVNPYNPRSKENPNANKTWRVQAADYSKMTLGAFRFPRAVSQALSLIAEIGESIGAASSEAVERLRHGAKVWVGASNSLSIMRAIHLSLEVPDKLQDAAEKTTTKNVMDAAHGVFDWVGAICYSTFSFTMNPVALQAGDAASLGGDIVDAAECATTLQRIQHAKELGGITTDIEGLLEESAKLEMWKIAKAVGAIATGILGMVALVLGPIAPAMLLLTISLVTSVLAMRNFFAERVMARHLVLNDQDVRV